jgi:hypothetical protein
MLDYDITFSCPHLGCDAKFTLSELERRNNWFPIIICPKCDRILELRTTSGWHRETDEIFECSEYQFEVRTFNEENLAIIPKTILVIFKEALQCYNSGSYYACIAMCRRIVEGIVVSKKAKGRNLKEKIDNLGNARLIRDKVVVHDHYVRSLGNIAAHFDETPENELGERDARVCLATVYEVTKEVFLKTDPNNSGQYGIGL